MLEPDWGQLSAGQRELRYADHCHVNEIIKRTIDSVQDEVLERYSPVMDVVDKVLGPIDEWLASLLIADWRDEVWDRAIHLMETEDADQRQGLCEEIEVTTLKRAGVILLT